MKQNLKNILALLVVLVAAWGTEAQNVPVEVEQLLNEHYGDHKHTLWESEYYQIEKKGRHGLTDLKGNEILPPVFYTKISKDEAGNLVVNLPPGNTPSGYGIYSPEGKELIPPRYNTIHLTDFYTEKLVYEAEMDKKTAYYDTSGVEILPLDFYYLRRFDQARGWAIVSIGGKPEPVQSDVPIGSKSGIFDMNNRRWIASPQYDQIDYLQGGFARFNKGGTLQGAVMRRNCVGGLWGYMDENGQEVIPARYEAASLFSNGIATVVENGQATILTNPKTGTNLKLANGTGGNVVDADIPLTDTRAENTFAFIIANQNYTHYGKADYALNDGKVFRDYCVKTLGMPENNVRFYEDATYGNMIRAIEMLKNIADVYEGDAAIILYYSGLGTTDTQHSVSYLLPTDANPSALEATGYSLQRLSDDVADLKTRYSLLFIDTGFAGTDRNGKLLEKNRAVQLSSKRVLPRDNTVVFTASGSKETAFSQEKLAHGLFTHALLSKLQQSKGNCTLGELADYIVSTVKKDAMKTFSQPQTPSVSAPAGMEWRDIQLNR